MAATAFGVKQKTAAESVKKTAELLPQLILEQLSSNGERRVPDSELLDRTLNELQTERLSLFLQLSKEVKARDSLFIEKKSPRALEKAIIEADKKIADLQDKIAKNLEKAQKETQKFERSERGVIEEPKKDESGFEKFKSFLPFSIFKRDEETKKIVKENVKLYNNDASSLFKPSSAALSQGFQSRAFEKEAVSAKINAVLSGTISNYGEYVGVTVELTVYPGARSIGVATDVGQVSDVVPLARRLVRNLVPKIANSLPVLLEFDVRSMEENQKIDASIMVDGVVIKDFSEGVLFDSGIHTIGIESPGFRSTSITYAFSGESRFLVKASLLSEISGEANIRIKNFPQGTFFSNAIFSSPMTTQNNWARLSVNGRNVLGVFENGETKERAFVFIPSDLAIDGENLKANAKTFDRAANIDKRRRGMYIAYSALICTLPITFYCLGEFTAAKRSYEQGRISYDEAVKWQNRTNITQAISFVCAGWFAIELVRYLWAANRVLPAQAQSDGEIKKAVIPLDENFLIKMNTEELNSDSN